MPPYLARVFPCLPLKMWRFPRALAPCGETFRGIRPRYAAASRHTRRGICGKRGGNAQIVPANFGVSAMECPRFAEQFPRSAILHKNSMAKHPRSAMECQKTAAKRKNSAAEFPKSLAKSENSAALFPMKFRHRAATCRNAVAATCTAPQKALPPPFVFRRDSRRDTLVPPKGCRIRHRFRHRT